MATNRGSERGSDDPPRGKPEGGSGEPHRPGVPGRVESAPTSWPDEAAERALVLRIRAAASSTPETAPEPAWAELVHLYQDRLFTVCVRMVGNADAAADLTQDTFIKIIQGLDSYDGRSRLSTWMTRVAMNVCLSHIRSQKLRRHASLDAMEGQRSLSDRHPSTTRTATDHAPARGAGSAGGPEIGEPTPDERVQQEERYDVLKAALASLPADQRAIMILRDVQGLDYDQVAEVLGIAAGTVKSRLFRARLALREAIEVRSKGGQDDARGGVSGAERTTRDE